MSRSASHSVRRPRAAHLGPAARRPLVLDAALRVWDEHGFAGTTTAAIAHEAGVSKPVLYECFETKEAILRALLDREEERLMDTITAAMPTRIDPVDPVATFTAIHRRFYDSVETYPISWRVFLNAGRTVPASLAKRVADGRLVGVLGTASLLAELAAAQEREVSPREIMLHAEVLVTLVERSTLLLLEQEPGPEAWTPATLSELTGRIAMHGWGEGASRPVTADGP